MADLWADFDQTPTAKAKPAETGLWADFDAPEPAHPALAPRPAVPNAALGEPGHVTILPAVSVRPEPEQPGILDRALGGIAALGTLPGRAVDFVHDVIQPGVVGAIERSDVLGGLQRGATSTLASSLHSGADLLDQTVMAPNRLVLDPLLRPLTVRGNPAATEALHQSIRDPLGVGQVADESLAVEREINADRQRAMAAIGAAPTLGEMVANPQEAIARKGAALLTTGVESAPAMALAVASRNPELGSTLLSGTTGAQEYTDLRAQGIPRAEAARAAALTALAEKGGEQFGLERVMAPGARGSILPAIAGEGGQEFVTQLAQQSVEDQALGRETPVLDQILGAVDAAIIGGGFGAGAHGASVGIDALGTREAAPFPNAAPRAPAAPAEAPQTSAIDPAVLAAGNAALAAAPAGPVTPSTAAAAAPAPLGQAEDTDDLDRLLAANLPPDALAALGDALAPNPAPAAATPTPAGESRERASLPAQDFIEQASAAMRMRAQAEAARTAAPAAQPPAVPVGSRPAGGDLADRPGGDTVPPSSPITAAPAAKPTADPTMQNRDRSRAASVAQMQDIRRNPDPDRLGFSRDPNTGAPMIGEGRQVPEADKGREDSVVMASGRRVPVRYAVVEADDLAASHDADGKVNPGYDAAPLKALNNGRTAGLQAAYAGGNTDAYRQGIAADAALHGVSPEAIAGKRSPVLVRLYDPALNTGDMGAESNASQQLGMSPVEQAQTDARSLPDLSDLTWGEDGGIPVGGNVDFFRRWFRNMGETQAASLQDAQGRPNAAALTRLRGAMVQRAYGDERLLAALAEDVNPDNRNILNAMAQAAPAFATLEGDSLADGVRDALVGGLELVREAANQGQTVEKLLEQGDLLGRDPNAADVARFMAANARSTRRMAEAFRAMAGYTDQAQRQAASLDVFGGPPPATVGGAINAAGIEADARADARGAAQGRGVGEPAQGERAGAGDAFALEGVRAEPARQEVAPTQGGGLFGAPRTSDFVDAARRSRDAARNGQTGTGRTDMLAGDGELFAGARPEQARVPEADAAAERDFATFPVRVLEGMTADERASLFKQAGVRTMGSFEDLPRADQAAAYARHVASGGRRVEVPADYNADVRQRETEADLRRRESRGTIAAGNGAPYKTEKAARAALAGLPEAGSFAREAFGVAKQGDGFVLRRLDTETGMGALSGGWVGADVGRAERSRADRRRAFAAERGLVEDKYGNLVTREEAARVNAEPDDSGLDQVVFHGTPARGIDRFSSDYMGTGEGAQAFGWGHYFASRKDLAEQYRHVLSARNGATPDFVKDGQTLSSAADIAEAYFQPGDIVNGYGGRDRVVRFARDSESPWRWEVQVERINKEGDRAEAPRWHSTFPEIRELESKLRERGWIARRGQVYQVEVPEDSDLLDYDKPLTQQPEKVRAGIEQILASGALDREAMREWQAASDEQKTGKRFYTVLSQSDAVDGARGASETLLAAGIPGLRYLDGASRNKGEGSHNYVIWDEAAIGEPEGLLEQREFGQSERDLVVTHNLTADKLMHAIRMGGLAVPSLAVTRGDSSITGFGDITLVGDPGLADPRQGAKAFGADVYSPRYPEVLYKLTPPAVKKLNAAIGAEGARWQQFVKPDDLTHEQAFKDHMERAFGPDWRYSNATAEAARILREAGATEHTFEGFTYSGNRRYSAHTLESVVKKLKKDLRGGENFSYGVGSLRAKFTPQFRSVEAIRKEKGRIVSSEDFERVKKEVDDEFFGIVSALAPHSDRGDSFGFADTVIDVMSDAAKLGVPRALREYGIVDAPADVQADIAGFLGKLRTLPTEYFEIIQPRAVEISEFKAAVIPSDTKPEVREALTERGLDLFEYEPGNDAARRAAVKQAAEASAALFNEEPGQSASVATTPAGSDLADISRRMGEADAERLGLRAAVNEALGKVGEKVIFLRGYEGLPEKQRRGIEARMQQREGRGRTAALYDPATKNVYVFTQVVRKPDRAVWNAAHEIAGHEGLRTLLGDKLDHALGIALQNPTVAAVADAIASERVLRPDQRMLAAEEALAELAAAVRTGNFAEIEGRYAVPVPEGIRERLTRAIENFLRRLKAMVDDIFGRHQFTDEDVRALLENAWQAVNAPANGELAPDLDGVDATAADQTQTPAFRKWFGDSKVVDENGAPLVVYHGTTSSFDSFADEHRGKVTRATSSKAGFFFASTPRTAQSYADHGATVTPVEELVARAETAGNRGDWDTHDKLLQEAEALESSLIGDGRARGQNIMPVYISLQNPLEIDASGENPEGIGGINKLIAQAKRRGHDGVIIRNFDDAAGLYDELADHYIAFEPEQIKSATANRGTFDPSSPSILESVDDARDRAEARRNEAAGTLPIARGAAGWNYDAGKWEGRKGQANNARAALQDKMLAWRDVQGQIEANLQAAIPDAQNVYRLENLMHGRVSEGIDRIEREQVKPLVDAMRAAKVEPATLEEYLYARHAQERNAQIATINPAMPDGGSGMTNAEAAKILASAEKATLEPLAKRVDAIAKATRRRLLANGLITQEAFDAMDAQYQHYVPLRGKATAESQDFGGEGMAGRGLDSRGKPVRNAMGRGAGNRAQHILGEVIGDAERSVILAEKARVGRAVMRIVLANPNPSLWQVEPVNVERALDASGEVYEKVVNDWSDPSVVAVRHKGHLYRVQINSVPLAKALNNVGVDQLGSVTRMAGTVNRYFSAILTKYNPAFTPVNATRDALFGLTGLAAEHGEAAALDAALHYPQAARAAFRQARGASGGGQWDTWAAEFAEAGGKTGYVNMPSAEEIARKIGSGSLTSYSPTGLRRAASVVGEAVGVLNDAVENALRLSAYVTLRKRGASAEAAAAYAKDLTVNFNRKGFDGSKFNAWFLFYNASIQGAHRVSKLARKPKTWGYLGALATAQVIATMAAMGMEDDNGEPLWNKVPDHVKRRNLVIVLPDGGLITVPMPYGFNLFPYMAGRITESVMNGKRGDKRASDGAAQLTADFIGSGLESFSPVPLDDGVAGLLPTILRIPTNVWANKNDFGGRIRNEAPFAKSEVPRASMGRPDTLEVFKLASKGLNRLGGGDDLTPPPLSAFDVAPEDLEYLVKTFTGGPGRLITDIATVGQKVTGGDYAQDADAKDIPIFNRFRTNIDEQAAQQAMFYDRRETIDRSLKRVRLAFKNDGEQAAQALLESTPELSGAAFKRRKGEGHNGEPPGSIILVGGNPQIIASDDGRNRGTRGRVRNPGELSVFAAYKAAEDAISNRNENVDTAYAGAPVGLRPNRERDAFIRTEDRIRQSAQAEFNAAWVRDVVGAVE